MGNKSGLPEREQELEERPRARRWVTAGKGAMDGVVETREGEGEAGWAEKQREAETREML